MAVIGINTPWKPTAILNKTQDEDSNKLRTEWGNLKEWDLNSCSFQKVGKRYQINSKPGKLPIFKSIRELKRDEYGFWMILEGKKTNFTGLILPYLTNRDISNLSRHEDEFCM